MLFIIEASIIKGAIKFSTGRHSEEQWRASCPLQKVTRASRFFFLHISVQINVSSTINMPTKGSIKSLPCRGLLLLFYEFMKLGILALNSQSYILDLDRVKLSLGIFLFSELFNEEIFVTSFQDLPFLCQKHTPKSRKFIVCLILPVANGP